MIETLKQMVKALEANRPINYCENGKGERFPMFENNPFRQEANEQAIQAGKQAIAELESQERNFCPRCGKRTADLTTIHTCTPPDDNALQRGLARTKEVAAGSQAFYGFPHGPVSTPNAGGKCVTAGETAPKEST